MAPLAGGDQIHSHTSHPGVGASEDAQITSVAAASAQAPTSPS